MKDSIKYTLIIFFLLLVIQTTVQAKDRVLVLETIRIACLEKIILGFSNVFDRSFDRLLITKEMDIADVLQVVREKQPDLMLAVCMDALKKVEGVTDIPIIYVQVLEPETIYQNQRNITGVSPLISPKRQLAAVLRYCPQMRRIGVIYSPAAAAHMFRSVEMAAKAAGVKLVANELRHPSHFRWHLEKMKHEIDLFWLIPDEEVYADDYARYVLAWSAKEKIPLLTFAKKYAVKGAFISVAAAPSTVGREAGEMALSVLKGTDIRTLPPTEVKKPTVSVNMTTVTKFGIKFVRPLAGDVEILY